MQFIHLWTLCLNLLKVFCETIGIIIFSINKVNSIDKVTYIETSMHSCINLT